MSPETTLAIGAVVILLVILHAWGEVVWTRIRTGEWDWEGDLNTPIFALLFWTPGPFIAIALLLSRG